MLLCISWVQRLFAVNEKYCIHESILTRWWWRQSVPNVPFELNDIRTFFFLLFVVAGVVVSWNWLFSVQSQWMAKAGHELWDDYSIWSVREHDIIEFKWKPRSMLYNHFRWEKCAQKILAAGLSENRELFCATAKKQTNNWTTTATSTKCMAIATDTYIYTSNRRVNSQLIQRQVQFSAEKTVNHTNATGQRCISAFFVLKKILIKIAFFSC